MIHDEDRPSMPSKTPGPSAVRPARPRRRKALTRSSFVLGVAFFCVTPAVLMSIGLDLSTPVFSVSPVGDAIEVQAALKSALLATNLQAMLGWGASFAAITFCILAAARYRVGRDPVFPILGSAFLSASVLEAIPNFVWLADSGVSVMFADSQAALTWIYLRGVSASVLAIGVLLSVWSVSRARVGMSCAGLAGVGLLAMSLMFAVSADLLDPLGSWVALGQKMVPVATVEKGTAALHLGVALFLYPRFWRRQRDVLASALVLAVVPQLAADGYLMASRELMDSFFNSARMLTGLAYVLPLGGLLLEILSAFRQHEDQAHRLSEQSARFRAQAEDLDQARMRAEEASRAKSEFLANMSHEIRTPLTAIVGYAELLVRPRRESADREAWIKGLRRGSNHLLSLVNDILDLSKIEAGKMGVSKTAQSPVHIVRQVVQLMRPQAREKMLNLSFELTGNLPREIDTDEVRLRQILVNLVSNAIKFTDVGGVTIRMRVRRPSPPLAVLEISVEDTGIGIPEEKLSAVFAPFTQVAEGTREGTGLGLDISIRMAQLLGGDLSVQSTEGEGSTFFLSLNLGPMSELDLTDPAELNRRSELVPSEQNAGVEDVRFDGLSVLVVDDGRDNQRILRFLLEEAGAQVGLAENGREAIDLIAASGKRYDLVLMDVQMPVMDGYEATEKLREMGFEAPIIAVTAYALARDLERVLAVGCDDFVTKPLIPADLLRTVERWLPPRETVRDAGSLGSTTELAENERFRPLLEKFQAGLSDRVSAMESARAEGDETTLLRLFHQLKGSAGSYGYPHISELARACEDSLRDGSGLEVLNSDWTRLVEALHEAREEAAELDPVT